MGTTIGEFLQVRFGVIFGTILRVFCKENIFAHSLTVDFLFYLCDCYAFLLFCLFFQQS